MDKTTTDIAEKLLTAIRNLLTKLGIDSFEANKLDEIIYFFTIIAFAILIWWISRLLAKGFLKKVIKRHSGALLQTVIEKDAISKVLHLIPPLIIIALIPFAFEDTPRLMGLIERFCWIYFIIVFMTSTYSILSVTGSWLANRSHLRESPLTSVLQLAQVLLVGISGIVIIAILIDKSPANLITGLGAFAAVVLLVFKDSILGFVAGILLDQNDMIRHGDWIQVEGTSINGVITEISINTIKVQNFDNTIVTVPPYNLISQPFINWRGMSESGGRRIKRTLTIDFNSIQFCTTQQLEEWKSIPLITNYITEKLTQQAAGKVENTANSAGLPNGTIETNLGVLRAYMVRYLSGHSQINKELLLMVQTLEATQGGLPIQIYCFSGNKDWVSYESILSEIMEHFSSILPVFGLIAYQQPSGKDITSSAELLHSITVSKGIEIHSNQK